MNTKYAMIFFGKSGSGKGTQIKEFSKYLAQQGEESVAYLEAGQIIRDFIATDTYTAKMASAGNERGRLQPAFLAIWAWVNKMISTFNGQKIICIDGAPRKLNEAIVLDEMLDFYGHTKRIVLYFDIADEVVRERLRQRARGDDASSESVEKRLEWFNQNSKEIIPFFEASGKYTIVYIDASRSTDEIKKDVIKAFSHD